MPIFPKIFIAYSRKDEPLLDQLRTHLTPIERSGKVEIWYDGKIEPGLVWEKTIKTHLHDADFILMLVSADAIASDYFYDKEMKDALDRHESGSARVVPLILRPCAWDATPLAKLQALPKDALAVTSWPDRDAAFSDAVSSLWEMIQNYITDKKQQIAAEKKEQERKEAAAKREIELQEEKVAAVEHQKEQEKQMAELEVAAQIRRKKREAQEKINAEKRAASRKILMTKVTSFFRKPIIWGLLALVVAVFGLSQLLGGKDEGKIEADEAKEYTAEVYQLVLASYDNARKLDMVKQVKNSFGLGLKDAKHLVDSAPKKFEKKMSFAEANEYQSQFKEMGAELFIVEASDTNKFELYLDNIGDKKISVIKVIKAHLGVGLKEAKMMADRAPATLSKGLSLEKAVKLKSALESAGATVTLK